MGPSWSDLVRFFWIFFLVFRGMGFVLGFDWMGFDWMGLGMGVR